MEVDSNCTITLDSDAEWNFLRFALGSVCKVYDACDLEHLYSMRESICENKQDTYTLNAEQVEGFRAILRIFNNDLTTSHTIAGRLMNQLPEEPVDAPKFHEILVEAELQMYIKDTLPLFTAWLDSHHATTRLELVNLIKKTGDPNWLFLYECLIDTTPCSSTSRGTELEAYERIIREVS